MEGAEKRAADLEQCVSELHKQAAESAAELVEKHQLEAQRLSLERAKLQVGWATYCLLD